MIYPLQWINFNKLREIPSRQSPFGVSKIVDLLEMWCISSIDKKVSTSQLVNFFDDDLAITEEEQEQDFLGDIPSKIRTEEFFNYVYARLKYRKDKWGDKWPFDIDINRNNIVIKYTPNVFTINYLTLLFCSNLHIINENSRHLFTSAFETLAFYHLSSIHSPENGWITKSMGANNRSLYTYVGTTQKEKLTALAKDLNCRLSQHYRPTAQGDGAIDLVSFLSFGDNRGASSVVFGQCACTNDKRMILTKISETSEDSIRDKIEIDISPLNYLYSPLDLISDMRSSGFDLDGTRKAIIIDRTRILLKDFDYSKIINSTLRSNIYGFIYLRENYYEA